MVPDRLAELLDTHLERRLTAADAAELNKLLRADPAARKAFWEYAQQHAMLADLLAEGRGRRLATPEKRPRRLAPAMLALAAAVVLAVGLGWLLHAPPEAALARLDELRGDVTIVGTSRTAARPGQALHPGEEIHTGEGGFAVVTYPDSSRLELDGDTSLRLLDAGSVFLNEGVVSARVSRPMTLSTLQADLRAAGGRFSSASVQGETRVEMERGKATLTLKGEARPVEIANGTFAVSSPDLEVFRPAPMLPASRDPVAVFEETSGPVLGLASIDQGKALAVACSNGLVKVWDVKSRRVRVSLDAGRKRALAVAASPDGRAVAAGYEPLGKGPEGLDSLMVWDTRRQALSRVLAGTRRVNALGFTPDGRSLVFSSHGKLGAWVWDLPDPKSRSLDAGRERFVLGDRDRVRALALSPDGKVVACGLLDGRVRLWDVDTGRPLFTLEGHTRDIQSLAFAPGGRMLASGGRDGAVRLWSAETGEELRTLTGSFGEARCLMFSPDGRTLVTGHAGLAVLWDVATGEQRGTLKAHKFAVTALVYLDGGRTLATAGWDRTVKLWALRPATGGPL